MKDTKTILSTLWIFVTANYIYCDVFSNMDSTVLKELLTGTVGSLKITQGFLLGAAVMMEIPMLMIVLSRFLGYAVSRPANIIAGSLMILIQLGSLFVGTAPTMHYVFFSIVEILGDALIVVAALRWGKAGTVAAEVAVTQKQH